jgi:repressor LexA
VTITHIETGQTTPTDRTLRLLAQELHSDFGRPWLRVYTQPAITMEPGEVPVYFGEEEHRIIGDLAKQESRAFADQVRELTLEALMNRRLITDHVDTNVVFLADRVPRMVTMPLLGEIAAGQPIEAVGRTETVEIPETFLKPTREQFILRARGESMIDEGIHDGSLLVCDVTNTAKNGDMVVALIDGEQATVKKFYKEKTRIRLQPANKLLDPIYVDPKRLQIQGVVVGIIRHRP